MLQIDWQKTLPVIVSILIILLIALARQYSRTLASIFATMPINIPLGLWVVYGGVEGDSNAMAEFSKGLFINIFPTVVFIAVAWYGFSVNWNLLKVLIVGYLVWAVCLVAVMMLRNAMGW